MLQQRHKFTWALASPLLLLLLFMPVSLAAETISDVSPPVKLTLPSVKQPPRTGRRNKDAIAVLIGNRDYDRAPKVQFAIRDMNAVEKHLVNILGYQSRNIIRLENAKLSTLYTMFGSPQRPRGKLAERTAGGTYEVFVYYSGHGAPAQGSRRGYLLPVDGDQYNIEHTGYPLETLSENLSGLKTRQLIVVLDTCFSGMTAGGTLFPGTSRVEWEVDNPLQALDNAFVLTASGGKEMAHWYFEKRQGLFTYWFLLSLQMLGSDPRKSPPTADALRAFIAPRVTRATQGLQTPEIVGPPGRPIFR